jgi:TDG/mug DNA glycosylase family protein
MQLLDEIVGPEPVILFCGMAGAESTKHRDHYYASPGNNF